MEKQGMDKRRRFFRAGLLIFFFTLFPAVFLFAQDSREETGEGQAAEKKSGEESAENAGEEILEIQLDTSSANPVVNRSWSIILLVNHPVSAEVKIKPPSFPAFLYLDRVRMETRLIQKKNAEPSSPQEGRASAPQNERWTRAEFLFTPQKAGAIVLEPFEVNVPGRKALSAKTAVRFREAAAPVRRYEPRFRWLGTAAAVAAGTRGNFNLELSNWDPQKEAPSGLFRGRTPLNAILEESPPLASGEGIYRYAVTMIPLASSGVVIEAFSFSYNSYTLSVPRLSVPVPPAPAEAPGNQTGEEDSREEQFPRSTGETDYASTEFIPQIPFPEERERVFPFFRGTYNRIYGKTRLLWEENHRAEALAEIRRNERDSPIGPYLVSLRREMEQALALGFTGDENWRPLKLPLVTWVIMSVLAILAALVLFIFRPRVAIQKKSVTYGRRSGYKTIIALVLVSGAAFIFVGEGLGNFPVGRLSSTGNQAVLLPVPAYRIPDSKAAINAVFGEGQPVIVGDYRGDWCYAEAPDGRAGWVVRETVIIY